MPSQQKVNVYINTPYFFARTNNTDWRYTRFAIPQLGGFQPDCSFTLDRSFTTLWRYNKDYVLDLVSRKSGFGGRRASLFSELDESDLRNSHADLVFSHSAFPTNARDVPVIWQNSILDPEMVKSFGYSEADQTAEMIDKHIAFSMARLVQVSSVAEQERLGSLFPDLRHKFVAIPFFLPQLNEISASEFAAKTYERGVLRCLFVGHDAKRKGLDRVYSAINSLAPSLKKRITLTVVSAFRDGRIDSPPEGTRLLSNVTNAQVLMLMRNHDVLAVPSRFESFGFVYVEAMSQGLIPIVPNWEVQREIVDYGRCGRISSGDSTELSETLGELLDNSELRKRLSNEALLRYRDYYCPAVIASKYRDMFANAVI
jgi:glycosyltransferase involved in cell wall biosynthesis